MLGEFLQTSEVPSLQCAAEVAYAGSATIASAPLSPPRTRRVQGLTESDDEPVLAGDGEIANQDYRCGGPVLVRLPARSQGLTNDEPLYLRWIGGVRDKVHGILQEFGIGPAIATAVKRREKTTVDTASHLTILVVAKKDEEAKESWYAAAKAIRKLLCNEGLAEVNVELLDDRADCQ